MAVKDTHKVFERLRGAGYSKEMAEALLDTLGDSWDTLATKADLDEVRGDIKALEAATKAEINGVRGEIDGVRGDIKALEAATRAEIDGVRGEVKALETATKADMREMELRMRLHLYAVAIVVIGVLAALELIPR